MKEWQGQLTKNQAIKLLERITDQVDPYWADMVADYYDEKTDTMPSIYHLYEALGVTKQEYQDATGANRLKWPSNISSDLPNVIPGCYNCTFINRMICGWHTLECGSENGFAFFQPKNV